MNIGNFKKRKRRTGKRFGRALALLGLMAGLLRVNSGFAEDSPVSEYQVKAIFLFNFAKYVDWPATAFTNAATPITIGVLGTDPFGDNLQNMVKGKTINGRTFLVKHLTADSDLSGCQILFISDSEASRMGEILAKAGALPILTVGEGEDFAKNDGIIHFILKDGKVRLEIDLTSVKKTGLAISSKLLAVADVVKGKFN
jgi:YfiR/HmsC-like